MNAELHGQQRLLLYRLAFSPDGSELQKNVKPATCIETKYRKPLLERGLIEIERTKQGNRIRLTDPGWAWCNAHLADDFSVRSTLGTEILKQLLGLLKQFFERQDHTASLGQFVQQATRPRSDSARDGAAEALPDAIRRTCLDLGNGRTAVRVRLADLRGRLNGVGRNEVDRTLLEMERRGELTLYRLDDPREIRPEDRAAELRTPTGQERHIVYFGGPRS